MNAKFAGWPLDKKIYYLVTSLIYAISIIMLAVFSVFYVSSYIAQSGSIAGDQLSSLAANYDSAFNNYKELAESLTIDDAIQAYVKNGGQANPKNTVLTAAAKNTLQNVMNMHVNLMYAAVISYRFDGYIYKGTISKINSGFTQIYPKDYAGCLLSRDSGTLRMSYNNAYVKEKRLLNIYFPIYSLSNIIHENGLLCMIFDDSPFRMPIPPQDRLKFDSDLIMIDSSGGIVSSSDERLIGAPFGYAGQFTALRGSFISSSSLYIYRKIGGWQYYLVSRIPLMGMYRDCLLMMALLIVICAALAYVGQRFCRRILYKTYQPVNDVINMMNRAAEGMLDVRVDTERAGVDFVTLAVNFNNMMDKINKLMVQIKQDQKTADQLRFNALQSQIQPHFLYNALDSIHWQASADGNQEMSEFVKALAQFYRLCLSKGQDIIPLEQEFEHVRNYLIIQNIRYDHRIKVSMELADDCRDAPIPKITVQPLAENAIYHGMNVKGGFSGELRIQAVRQADDVCVYVSDDGAGMTDEQISQINRSIAECGLDYGYGVQNVSKRIQLLYGTEYGLHYEKNLSGGITVKIRLPGAAEV